MVLALDWLIRIVARLFAPILAVVAVVLVWSLLSALRYLEKERIRAPKVAEGRR